MAASHSIQIDAETRARMERLAEARQQTMEEVLHDVVEQYAEREEKRGEFLRAGQAAWDDYLATGLHASGEEVDAWLARVEAGEDVPPPACHK